VLGKYRNRIMVLATLLVAASALHVIPRLPKTRIAGPIRCSESATSSNAAVAEALMKVISDSPCVVFSRTTCPYCLQTKECLDRVGATYRVVELDADPQGPAMRKELASLTGRTSVPAVFIGGIFAGGANDGGLGGVLTLQREGALEPLLVESGALDLSGQMSDPVAQLFSSLFQGGSGKRIAWGVLQQDVDPAAVPDADERARRREVAASSLTNIDAAERQRRQLAGTAMSIATGALAVSLLAAHAAPLTRVAIAPPLFLAYGYLASAREGL